MKTKLLMLTVAMSCVFAGNAMALTQVEYKTQKDQISADYKVGRDKCGALAGLQRRNHIGAHTHCAGDQVLGQLTNMALNRLDADSLDDLHSC